MQIRLREVLEKDQSILDLICSDYRRYRATGGAEEGSFLGVIFLVQGFWASVGYRLAHWVHQIKIPFIRQPLRICMMLVQKWIEIVTAIHLPPECHIAKGLYLGHFGPTVVHPRARIGENCNLSQGVTVGLVHRGERQGIPQIGDRVYIGPNAVVIGGITIGNDVAIGAGAVVTQSLPDRAVAVGNPARIISYQGVFDFVRYDLMDQDLKRLSSLKTREPEQTNTEWKATESI